MIPVSVIYVKQREVLHGGYQPAIATPLQTLGQLVPGEQFPFRERQQQLSHPPHLNTASQAWKNHTVKPLKNLKNLKSLDLYSCEITTLEDYRESVFELLPQVNFLDGYDHEDNEVPDSEADDDDNEGLDSEADDDDEHTAGPTRDGDDDEDDEGSEGEEVGLSYLMKDGIQDEEDDDDYVEEEEEEDGVGVQGEKRKRDAEDEGDDSDGDDD
ncbi:acidic leucine-rich nuclear phosphoprotein 32 family member E-like [Salvelinus fontinalis]|uniref:acidic leucine-rich nuclear phosphoprotein 32 family member E-like n=1 Tax=Salvelinus fontinalis TaxID=8038 RepID=UPI002485C819|nr:acidic leucine-rich nuclear phosphoprotein 32 family member E-like [Salvelinus fontinalis]